MRLKIIIDVADRLTLLINYTLLLTGVIYRFLAESDAEYAAFLLLEKSVSCVLWGDEKLRPKQRRTIMCRTIYDNFESELIRYDMFYEGDNPQYPQHARKAFPILIERARNQEQPIGYAELADQLCIEPYPSRAVYIGLRVLPCISTKLYQLEQRTGERSPRLTNIVFSNDSLSNSRNYIVRAYQELHGSMLTWEDYEDKLLAPIHAYENWDQVLNQINELRNE